MFIPRFAKSTFLLCLLGISAHAYTVSGNVYSTNGSQSDVQAAINAAADGDVIQLPAGSFTWSTGTGAGPASVTVNTGVKIQGAGASLTTITNPGTSYWLILLNADLTAGARVTGIGFLGQNSLDIAASAYVYGTPTALWRVDNCSFYYAGQGTMMEIWGNVPGVIDHCSFQAGSGAEMIHNVAAGPNSTAGWTDNVYPGSANALYIEDCTFSNIDITNPGFLGCSAIQSYYGARTVMRYCQLNYCQIDQHGNVPPLYGARWFEFYNNTFYVPPNGNQSDYFQLRSGSGVVFNNHVSGGPNTGAGAIELYSDETTNPALCGPGGGIFVNGNRSFSPVYIWGNDSSMPVGSTSSNVIQGRDYLVSGTQPTTMIKWHLTTDTANTTYSYTPYVYPHPLDHGSTSVFGPQ